MFAEEGRSSVARDGEGLSKIMKIKSWKSIHDKDYVRDEVRISY